MQERSKQEMVYSEISLAEEEEDSPFALNEDTTKRALQQPNNSDNLPIPLRCVDLENSSFFAATQEKTWREETDLQPSVYEGGMKVWECSLDLVRYLAAAQQDDSIIPGAATTVLELGCGHGLPSCFLLGEYLRRQQQNINNETDNKSSPRFFLTDFNDFVLRDATLSNLVLNAATAILPVDGDDDEASTIQKWSRHVRLGHGDWLNVSQQLLSKRDDSSHELGSHHHNTPNDANVPSTFDVILAAETVYSDQAAHETAQLLERHLQPHTGVGLVATKRYYFGVGGGSDALRRSLRSSSSSGNNMQVETVRVYDNGAGNIRELLRVTWAA